MTAKRKPAEIGSLFGSGAATAGLLGRPSSPPPTEVEEPEPESPPPRAEPEPAPMRRDEPRKTPPKRVRTVARTPAPGPPDDRHPPGLVAVAPVPRAQRATQAAGRPVRVDVELPGVVANYLRDISRPEHTGARRFLGARVMASDLLLAAVEVLSDRGVDLRGVGDDRERLRERLRETLTAPR